MLVGEENQVGKKGRGREKGREKGKEEGKRDKKRKKFGEENQVEQNGGWGKYQVGFNYIHPCI